MEPLPAQYKIANNAEAMLDLIKVVVDQCSSSLTQSGLQRILSLSALFPLHLTLRGLLQVVVVESAKMTGI